MSSKPMSDFDGLRMFTEQGDAEAQLNLGCMYRNGEGIASDYV